MTKHDAMKAYFEPVVTKLANTVLNYNFSPDSPDGIGFLTNYSDKVLKRYIRVGADKAYGFSILVTKEYSINNDDLNLEAMNFVQGLMDWVDRQNREKLFPDFGEKCTVKRIENLQNMPSLAEVNSEEGVARYMFQCRVVYFEKER
nr:MAG TPA: Minor capsid protein from bacteriophage [Caudoviricetes sp.]